MQKSSHTVTIPVRDYEEYNKKSEQLKKLKSEIYDCFMLPTGKDNNPIIINKRKIYNIANEILFENADYLRELKMIEVEG